MIRDIKFIVIFSMLAIPLLLLLGINGLIGILSISCLCAIVAELLASARTVTSNPIKINNKMVYFCSEEGVILNRNS